MRRNSGEWKKIGKLSRDCYVSFTNATQNKVSTDFNFSSVFRSFKVHSWNVISDLKNLKSRHGFKMPSKTHTFQKEQENGYETVLRKIML